jgi:hypothetical protein
MDQPVGYIIIPVVDMRDDREVPDFGNISHFPRR